MFVVKEYKNSCIININAKKLEYFDCVKLKKLISGLSEIKNRDIVINLKSIHTLNNLFVEKIITSQKLCEKNNCTIALCGINHDSLCVFFLLKLDKYFEFYENEEEALSRENRLVKRRLKVI